MSEKTIEHCVDLEPLGYKLVEEIAGESSHDPYLQTNLKSFKYLLLLLSKP